MYALNVLTRGEGGQRGDSWADGIIINAADNGGKHPRYAAMNMLRINTEAAEEEAKEEEAECVPAAATTATSSVPQLPPDLTSVLISPIRHTTSASSHKFTPGSTGEVYVYKPVGAIELKRGHRSSYHRMIQHYNSAINDPGNTGHFTDYVM